MCASLNRELQELLNKYSMENGSDTPDFLLADYLIGCLNVFNATVMSREGWYGRTRKSFATLKDASKEIK